MRKKISETPNSKRAYYFGLISLILFFVQGILRYLKTVNDRNTLEAKLPDFLLWTTLLMLLFTASFCIISAIRSFKEERTPKSVLGWVLAIGCLAFLIFVVISL